MVDQINLNNFNEIYNKTYDSVVKYVLCRCENIDDVNDIIQDVYIELYKKLLDNKQIENINQYIIGIAKNKVKKHYSLAYRIKTISIFSKDNNDIELKDSIKDDIDIEKIIIERTDVNIIWKHLKSKNVLIAKIFYLYYVQSYTIKEISCELKIKESAVKNYLYRTLKELKYFFREE